MTRAYLRLDPGFFERKVIRQCYPPAVAITLIGVLCLAESQPERGRFRDERLLRAMLGDLGRNVPYLLAHGDLIRLNDGRIYPEGWDEWQEGDWKVGERVRRIRGRAKPTGPTVTADTAETVTPPTKQTVYTPSDGGRPAESLTPRVGKAGHSGAGRGKNLSKENPAPPEVRADVAAIVERWGRISLKQRAILEEVLGRHDVTGPAWAAVIIRSTPVEADPLAAVMAADRAWQAEQRARADADEAEWATTKAAEREPTKLAEVLQKAAADAPDASWFDAPAPAEAPA